MDPVPVYLLVTACLAIDNLTSCVFCDFVVIFLTADMIVVVDYPVFLIFEQCIQTTQADVIVYSKSSG